jgi:hypothetical protein
LGGGAEIIDNVKISMGFVGAFTFGENKTFHETPLPLKKCIDIGIQIAGGFTAALEKSIVHPQYEYRSCSINQ